jgi:hypothetical protein
MGKFCERNLDFKLVWENSIPISTKIGKIAWLSVEKTLKNC